MKIEPDSFREIESFVREKASLASTEEEGSDFYFQLVAGRLPNKGTRAPIRGIYLSAHPAPDELASVVVRFVTRALKLMSADWSSGTRAFLIFCQVGDNNVADSIEVGLLDDGRRAMGGGDAAEQIRRAGTGTLDGGAAIALLETNNMLRGMMIQLFADLRATLDQKTNAEGLLVELMAKVDTAERVIEVMKHETDVRKVDAMMDRLDPHMHQHGEGLIEVLQVLSKGWAWKWSGGAGDPCPDQPGPAADWLIERFEMAFWALGQHLEKHPAVLNKRRKAKLEKLIQIMFDLAAALDDDEDEAEETPAST